MDRINLINKICDELIKYQGEAVTKICIDGITASGKTTFAKDIASELNNRGITAKRISLDGFHNPREIRHQKGKSSPEGYYYDAYNYSEIKEYFLAPLSQASALQYRTQTFNLEGNYPELSDALQISPGSYIIVDGSFSLRKELYDYWDYSIYLKVDFEIAQERAGTRDLDLFGSKDKAKEATRDRYHQAHRLHNELEKPWLKAKIVIDNNMPLTPIIVDPTDIKG